MSVFNAIQRQKMKDILNNKSITINTMRIQTLEFLKREKISYEQPLHSDVMLCHRKNRGGLGINAHNCHKLAWEIYRIGGDTSMLNNALCFELAPEDKVAALDFNRKLSELSNGMIAPPSGSERFESVGASHSTGWARAVNYGCVTDIPSLQDGTGHLDKAALLRDPEMAKMLNTGWAWTIIPAGAAKEFPELPDMLQRSLNSSNTVSSDETELEVAVSIAEYASQMERGGEDVNWAKAVEAATAGDPACAGYASVIADLVRKCGGGYGAPAIKSLDAMAKKYSENRVFGEDFLRSVTTNEVVGSGAKHPRIFLAMLYTNMICKKDEKQRQQGLVPSDVQKMCKSKSGELCKLEDMLISV
jgi:hypothetical protein